MIAFQSAVPCDRTLSLLRENQEARARSASTNLDVGVVLFDESPSCQGRHFTSEQVQFLFRQKSLGQASSVIRLRKTFYLKVFCPVQAAPS